MDGWVPCMCIPAHDTHTLQVLPSVLYSRYLPMQICMLLFFAVSMSQFSMCTCGCPHLISSSEEYSQSSRALCILFILYTVQPHTQSDVFICA